MSLIPFGDTFLACMNSLGYRRKNNSINANQNADFKSNCRCPTFACSSCSLAKFSCRSLLPPADVEGSIWKYPRGFSKTMAFVFKVLKFASDFGNTSLRVGACCRPFQGLKTRTFFAQNGVVCSNAVAQPKLEPTTNPPPRGGACEGKLLKREWKNTSRRTGVIAIKLGMTQLWNKEGFPVAVTVLQVCLITWV